MSLQEGKQQLLRSRAHGLALPKGLVAKKTPPEWHLASAFWKAGFACGQVSCLQELGLTSGVMEKVTCERCCEVQILPV